MLTLLYFGVQLQSQLLYLSYNQSRFPLIPKSTNYACQHSLGHWGLGMR